MGVAFSSASSGTIRGLWPQAEGSLGTTCSLYYPKRPQNTTPRKTDKRIYIESLEHVSSLQTTEVYLWFCGHLCPSCMTSMDKTPHHWIAHRCIPINSTSGPLNFSSVAVQRCFCLSVSNLFALKHTLQGNSVFIYLTKGTVWFSWN